jgi:hypothetical protein
MENQREEEVRAELDRLLRQQAKVLESRSLGTATEVELLEYEIRQEIVRELWRTLVRSVAA